MMEYKSFDILENKQALLYRFLKKVPFGRFLSDVKTPMESSLAFEINNLLNYLKSGKMIAGINEMGEIQGIIGFHISDWDSNVFEKKIAIIQYFLVIESGNWLTDKTIASNLFQFFQKWSILFKIKVVITKLDSQYFGPVYILQENGFRFYECITYRTLENLEIHKTSGKEIIFRFANSADIDKLRNLSNKNTFQKSHFFLDENFEREKIEKMYTAWVENALNSDQKILILEENEKIAGAFIYEIAKHTPISFKKLAIWKSALVDYNFRNKGVGFKLFIATLQACINDGVDLIDSSLVEKNIVSQNFHDKLGFRLVYTQYTFHKWLT